MTNAASLPIIERVWPVADARTRIVRNVALVAVGTLLLTVAAKTQVPFWPVPMTLQTMAVVLLGASLGSRLGFATVLAYLAEGAAGLPVFAGTPERGIGLAYMLGPTGGYLLGFLLAATLVGWLVERGFARSLPTVALSVLLGHATIHVFGLAWLGSLVGFDKAVAGGLLPFLPADLLKAALSTAIILAARPLARR
ncbi:biotin transporter BioY [Aureimonas leprariae]|uniref:Biotin transporter n=1 Tax=Plantimonas leprariae TaxID=2615207 RepID=A0A7V7U065_9HYPH|nr:biotin transporter BioY [Aureimonas leprariae]KAB0680106.1 biotin transporter BioY [Aureimonas leprariae]